MRSIADNQRPDAVCLPAQQAEAILQPYWTLTLKSGLKVKVPADLDNPVTLTLLELEDWPEPEHAFCRQLAQPGLRLLDANTGYGLFALSLAQAL